jgi:hypothetical protein
MAPPHPRHCEDRSDEAIQRPTQARLEMQVRTAPGSPQPRPGDAAA